MVKGKTLDTNSSMDSDIVDVGSRERLLVRVSGVLGGLERKRENSEWFLVGICGEKC